MPEVPRQRVDAVLDECNVPGDREAYYRFIFRIAQDEMETKKELDSLVKEFKAKGCNGRALTRLLDLNSLYNPWQYSVSRGSFTVLLKENWPSLLAILLVVLAMLSIFHDSFIMDYWILGPTERLMRIGIIVAIVIIFMLLGLVIERRRRR